MASVRLLFFNLLAKDPNFITFSASELKKDELEFIYAFIVGGESPEFFDWLKQIKGGERSGSEFTLNMNLRRDHRGNRSALFDSIEEGGIRALSYSSHEINEQDNDRAINGLQDRVNILKRLTGDIHEEVALHNRALDRMGHDMDASRGVLSGTVDRFKMVFEKKSNRRMASLVGFFLALFLLIYYLTK